MTRPELLEEMRDDYRAKDLKSLKRHFTMGAWLLTEEDKTKISKTIAELEALPQPVQDALRILGGKLI